MLRIPREYPTLHRHDFRCQVGRRVRDVVSAVVPNLLDSVQPQRRLREPGGHHVVGMIVLGPMRLVADVRRRVLGTQHRRVEPPEQRGQGIDQVASVELGGSGQPGTLRQQRTCPAPVGPQSTQSVLSADHPGIVVVRQVQENQPHRRPILQAVHLDEALRTEFDDLVAPPIDDARHFGERGTRAGLPISGVTLRWPHVALARGDVHRGRRCSGTHRGQQIRIHEQDVVVRMRDDLDVTSLSCLLRRRRRSEQHGKTHDHGDPPAEVHDHTAFREPSTASTAPAPASTRQPG
nr:hypothetical protein [Saccharopolyspora sp. HNM0986]